jgi:hypothetical protein
VRLSVIVEFFNISKKVMKSLDISTTPHFNIGFSIFPARTAGTTKYLKNLSDNILRPGEAAGAKRRQFCQAAVGQSDQNTK